MKSNFPTGCATGKKPTKISGGTLGRINPRIFAHRSVKRPGYTVPAQPVAYRYSAVAALFSRFTVHPEPSDATPFRKIKVLKTKKNHANRCQMPLEPPLKPPQESH
ncbi:MAG: hypothetical protein WC729_19200 [Sphingomonas sp.]|jgi:hypothetical protein